MLGLVCACSPAHQLPDGAPPPPVDATPPRLVPGVHTPLAIDPDVEILDGQWLLDLYRIVLGREHDVPGYVVNFTDLQAGETRAQMYDAFVHGAEFTGNASLHDASGFVARLYQVLLHRDGSANEIAAQVAQLCNFDGTACPIGGMTWPQMIDVFYRSAEYKSRNCLTEYYTLGAPVTPGNPLLEDLFDGTARLQTIAESQPVRLTVPTATALWDQKLPVLANPSGTGWIGFTRAYLGNNRTTIVLLSSADAVDFTEVAPLFTLRTGETFYDPHVAIDAGRCPRRYVMAMECAGNFGWASLCTSQTSTPDLPETWPHPIVLVDGCGGGSACGTPAAQSASTGVTLVDGKDRYVAWTQVYDGVGADDPQAHTYSQALATADFTTYAGTTLAASSPIATMLGAEPDIHCADAWDCNNRDKQDWKREGDAFYAIYNGADYYRCVRPAGDTGTSRWGLSVARSPTAIGAEYVDRLPDAQVVFAERDDTCGISYPMLDVIDGELYVYYAYYPAAGGNRTMRAKLVRR